MPQKQQQNEPLTMAQTFNGLYKAMLVYQRAIIIPFRSKFGKEVFGPPWALAFLFMCAWAAFSRDIYMWVWVVLWLCFLAIRKSEAFKLAARGVMIHSQFDGVPNDMWYCRIEQTAKLIWEPIQCLLLGVVLLVIYQSAENPHPGMPYLFILGSVALWFTEKVK